MAKKQKREPPKLGHRRRWIKKWRAPATVLLSLATIYLLIAATSFFSGTTSEAYIEVFVGDWLKSPNDSRNQPVVFDVVTPAAKPVVKLPTENVVSVNPGIVVDSYTPVCGMSKPCPLGSFAVHIYTGKDHNDKPRLCVDGKYVIGGNEGGRGINVAIIDNVTKSITQVKTFDTYSQESTQLETLLLTLRQGDIIIMLTFDEATKKLSRVARLLFHDLGSAQSQNLQYRASWYLVTQKGLPAFTPYEGLHLVDGDGWPAPHDVHFCAPLKMKGQRIHPDPLPRTNPARQDFCQRHPVFPLFCDGDVVNDALVPSTPLKSGLAGNDIFSLPFIVMSGHDLRYLPATLETIVRQPGISPKNVVVFYLPEHPQVAELADLFGFMSEELGCRVSSCAHAVEALETTSLLFPDADSLLYLEQNVILSPDFLSFMGQASGIFKLDSTVDVVSAWNSNGYVGLSGDPSLLHRAERASALALLIRKKALHKDLCKNRTREDWLLEGLNLPGEVLVPDLSRVLFLPFENYPSQSSSVHAFVEAAVRAPRETSLLSEVALTRLSEMVSSSYDQQVSQDLASASERFLDEVPCTREGWLPSGTSSDTKGVWALHLPPSASWSSEDTCWQRTVATCLGLYTPKTGSFYLQGSRQGILRLTVNGSKVYVVSPQSSFSKYYRPQSLALPYNETV